MLTGIEKPQKKPILRTSFKYNHFGNVREIKDENSQKKTLVYDPLGRLENELGPYNEKLMRYAYSFLTSPTSPNKLTQISYRASNDSITSHIFIDGVGGKRQLQVVYGSDDIISAMTYDGMRRTDTLYKQYQVNRGAQSHTYDPSYKSNAVSYGYNSPAGNYPFTRNEFYADGSNRLKHAHAPGDTFQSETKNRYLKYDYSSEPVQRILYPNSTTSSDPGWTYSGGGSLHGALNDGANPDDNDYVKIQGPNGYFIQEDFIVKLDNYAGPINPTGSYIITFRAQVLGDPQEYFMSVQLLEGTTVKGTGFVNDLTSSYSNETFSVAASSITDPTNLSLIFIMAGDFIYAGDQVRISWAKVDLFFPDLYKTTTTDENGIKSLEYTDKFGNIVTSVIDSAGLKYTTRFEADVLGKRTKVTNPRGLISTSTYNTREFLIQQTSADAGTKKYRYDLSGNLRFTQDAVQAAAGRFTYQKYDTVGRIIEIGEHTGTFTTVDSTTRGAPSVDHPTSPSGGNLKIINLYDTNKTGLSALASARNLHGKLFNSQTYTNGVRDDIYYSYDDYGRIEWQIFQKADLSGLRKLSYEYNLKGDITKLGYHDLNKGYLDTYFFYEYDAAGRLSKVYSGRKSDGTGKITDGTYTTYANGRIQRLQLASAQGVDYRYNERDWLGQINHPDLTFASDPGGDSVAIPKDKFGMLIGYHKIQEIGTFDAVPARYNGDITWMKYNMSGVNYTGGAGTTSKVGRSFLYDNAERMTKANFGYYTTAWQSTAAFDEPTYTYDAAGNIMTLSRYGDNGVLMDNITYNYTANTNRLNYISDAVSSGTFSNDIDNQSANNYSYDANGNMTGDTQSGITTPIVYDLRNLPIQLTKSSVTTTYRYDAEGNRTRKSGTTAGTYYYINDQYGRSIAVLTSNGDPKMFNIHGHEHIGYMTVDYSVTYTPPPPECEQEFSSSQSSEETTGLLQGEAVGPDPCTGHYDTARTDYRFYYLKDQVGSIKMTVKPDGSIAGYDDYYPFGMIMAGRSMTSTGDGRYRFTSEERDTETGFDYFGARYYDPRVGRWMSCDPHMENYSDLSPYNYVGNNPLVYIDPTGMDSINFQNAKNATAAAVVVSTANPFPGPEDILAIGFLVYAGIQTTLGVIDMLSESATGEDGANISGAGKKEEEVSTKGEPRGEGQVSGKSVEEIKSKNPDWVIDAALPELSTKKGTREQGVSVQEIFINKVTGERIVRHTVYDDKGKIVKQGHRGYYKPRPGDTE